MSRSRSVRKIAVTERGRRRVGRAARLAPRARRIDRLGSGRACRRRCRRARRGYRHARANRDAAPRSSSSQNRSRYAPACAGSASAGSSRETRICGSFGQRFAEAWSLTGVQIIDESNVSASLSALPSRISERTHGALRGALDVELISGFLWATGGYAYTTAGTGRERRSTTFGELSGHTLGLGLEASAGGFTLRSAGREPGRRNGRSRRVSGGSTTRSAPATCRCRAAPTTHRVISWVSRSTPSSTCCRCSTSLREAHFVAEEPGVSTAHDLRHRPRMLRATSTRHEARYS